MGVPEKDVPRPEQADWISAKTWGEICRAANTSPGFAQLPQDMVDHTDQWRSMFDAVRVFVGVGVGVSVNEGGDGGVCKNMWLSCTRPNTAGGLFKWLDYMRPLCSAGQERNYAWKY